MVGECTGERFTIGMESVRQIGGRGRSKGLFNLGNHIASSDDEDLVANADAEAFHFTHIVKRGVLNGHPTHTLWCDTSHGRDVPGSSGLPFYVQQHREGLLWREFPCQGPTWVMGRHAQPFSLFEVVKFEHHAVDFVGVAAAFLRPCYRGLIKQGSRLGGRGCSMEFPGGRHNTKGILQPHQHVRIVVHLGNGGAVGMAMLTRGYFGIVRLKHQIAGICFPVGMLLSEGPCCQIAGVGRRFTVLCIKHSQRHHDLTTDVNVDGNWECVRNVGDFSSVSRHIFAALAAASGGGPHQSAHAVLQGKGRSVQFGLRKELQGTGGGDVDEVVQFLG